MRKCFDKMTSCLHVGLLVLICIPVITCANFKQWDYLVFAQQWSETSCIDEDLIKHGEHKCQVPRPVHSWAVHGVWPSRTGAKDEPVNCNKSWAFDERKIKPIEDQMFEFWPNCYRDTPLTSFWEHEWSKHGTCAASDPVMKDELAYFSTGLKLASKFNLTSWMLQAGLKPSNTTYLKLDTFYDIIKKNTGHQPILECVWKHESKVQFIGQVYMCLDKNFNPRECPTTTLTNRRGWFGKRNVTSFELCDSSKSVLYPEIYHIPDKHL